MRSKDSSCKPLSLVKRPTFVQKPCTKKIKLFQSEIKKKNKNVKVR